MLLTDSINVSFLQNPPRFLFFTGKGGVGKTSLSCASAVALAEQGKKTLIVSTDPASNLGQVLGLSLNSHPAAVPDSDGLWALNIDPRQSAADYRERVVGPYRGVLPDAAVAEIEEQLSGGCTVEVAAFDEFSRLMTDETIFSKYDHIVFDTAPTGHTLRLLQLPAAWKGYLDSSSGNSSCLGPMSGLKGQKEQFEATLEALTDENMTRLILVARADKHSIAEAQRTSQELNGLGVKNQWLAINGVLGDEVCDDEVASIMRKGEVQVIEGIPADLSALPRTEIPLSRVSPIGVKALKTLFSQGKYIQPETESELKEDVLAGTINIDELVNGLNMKSGIIMTMGKGGVGKTTLATAMAVQLADSGLQVHLTTSDPAAHIDFSLANKHKNLRISRINPKVETELYQQEVMQQAGAQLDKEGKRLLEEDLRSPCTEEVAVFRAFARVVEEAKNSVVVIDTAPTGHTLLLLDATQAYHRDASRNQSNVSDEVKNLLPRIRDSKYTKIMIVTLPEATPVQEASDLHKDLERAGISPYAWVINRSLLPLSIRNSVLAYRRTQEAEYIKKVKAIAAKTVVIPWQNVK